MNLQPENTVRAVDNLGRITLPKGLRERFDLLGSAAELEIFTTQIDGREYICMTKPLDKNSELDAAKKKLEDAGYKVIPPKEG